MEMVKYCFFYVVNDKSFQTDLTSTNLSALKIFVLFHPVVVVSVWENQCFLNIGQGEGRVRTRELSFLHPLRYVQSINGQINNKNNPPVYTVFL